MSINEQLIEDMININMDRWRYSDEEPPDGTKYPTIMVYLSGLGLSFYYYDDKKKSYSYACHDLSIHSSYPWKPFEFPSRKNKRKK